MRPRQQLERENDRYAIELQLDTLRQLMTPAMRQWLLVNDPDTLQLALEQLGEPMPVLPDGRD